jgi:hypothetical protein
MAQQGPCHLSVPREQPSWGAPSASTTQKEGSDSVAARPKLEAAVACFRRLYLVVPTT